MSISVDVDARAGDRRARPMGSSLRHRRLVLGGYVVFDPVALARPSMRPMEIELLTFLFRHANYALEFGAGGSTTLGVKMGLSHLISVESDGQWIARIKADEAAARAQADGPLTLLHADIGPIGALGGPASANPQTRSERWVNYPTAPWSHVDLERLDIVLIDGRFRVACILETLLQVDRRPLIAVHDFWNRPEYHVVLPFLDEVEACQTLGVFRAKAALDRSAIRELRARAVLWPR
jgi:hypothetical protein